MARHWPVATCAALTVLFVAVACSSHTARQAAIKSKPPAGPIASNLPPGVCAPTYSDVSDVHATRIEAKLVTRETLLATDPDFPPTWGPSTKYFWVVAKTGQFTMDGPMPPGATPLTLQQLVILLQAGADPADPGSPASVCGLAAITGRGSTAWPAWFDQMTALIHVKIR